MPAAAGDDELTPQQDQAILALLVCPTVAAAGKKAKVPASTLFTWLKQPAFKNKLTFLKRAAMDQAVAAAGAELRKIAVRAAKTLARNLGAPAPAAVQVRAAAVALDKLADWQQLAELQEQIEELKARLGVVQTTGGGGGDDPGPEGGTEEAPGGGPAGGPDGGPDPGAPALGPGPAVPGDGVAGGPVAGVVPLFGE